VRGTQLFFAVYHGNGRSGALEGVNMASGGRNREIQVHIGEIWTLDRSRLPRLVALISLCRALR